MTSTYRPNESKREEFRRYLEKGGVVDAVTRKFAAARLEEKHSFLLPGALVALYEEAEKPNNATEFVRRFMGASGPDSAEVEFIKNELMAAREKFEELTRDNEQLKEKLQKYEGSERGQWSSEATFSISFCFFSNKFLDDMRMLANESEYRVKVAVRVSEENINDLLHLVSSLLSRCDPLSNERRIMNKRVALPFIRKPIKLSSVSEERSNMISCSDRKRSR